jgi:hypothetical protein
MSLEMRQECENAAKRQMKNVCPNCGGELVQRPRRN